MIPHDAEHVLSSLKGHELDAFRAFCQKTADEGGRRVQLRIRNQQDNLPWAVIWNDALHAGGPVSVRTVLHGHLNLSSLVIWLGGYAKLMTESSLVSLQHTMEFESPVYCRVRDILERPILHTMAQDRSRYRYLTASSWLLSPHRVLSASDLKKYYSCETERIRP